MAYSVNREYLCELLLRTLNDHTVVEYKWEVSLTTLHVCSVEFSRCYTCLETSTDFAKMRPVDRPWSRILLLFFFSCPFSPIFPVECTITIYNVENLEWCSSNHERSVWSCIELTKRNRSRNMYYIFVAILHNAIE